MTWTTNRNTTETDPAKAFVAEARRRILDESRPRILRCLRQLNEEQLWWRPNPRANSVGHLVLHLCGNTRQWLMHGVGGEADVRQRDQEFNETGPIPAAQLIEQFDQLMADAERVLEIVDPTTLLQPITVQGFTENRMSAIMHVVEHLSYHGGQIAWITKMLRNADLGYYHGADLNVTG